MTYTGVSSTYLPWLWYIRKVCPILARDRIDPPLRKPAFPACTSPYARRIRESRTRDARVCSKQPASCGSCGVRHVGRPLGHYYTWLAMFGGTGPSYCLQTRGGHRRIVAEIHGLFFAEGHSWVATLTNKALTWVFLRVPLFGYCNGHQRGA